MLSRAIIRYLALRGKGLLRKCEVPLESGLAIPRWTWREVKWEARNEEGRKV
jgi:hypothetical protein